MSAPPSSSQDAAAAAKAPRSSSKAPRAQSRSGGGEDLSKTWRTLANCLIMASQKADKAANAPPAEQATIQREMDEYVVNYLRNRVKWGRLLSYLEAELEGRAQELQSIQHYHRTMPKCSRPEKRARLEDPADGLEDVPPLPPTATPPGSSEPSL